MYVFPCCTIAVQYAALLFCWFATILILHFYRVFVLLELFLHASYLLPFKTKTMDSRKLYTELWFVYRRTKNMGENSIRSMITLLQLNNKGSRMHTILQTWCAYMASTFYITFSIRSTYISFNKGQSLHVIPHFFGGNTWGKIA